MFTIDDTRNDMVESTMSIVEKEYGQQDGAIASLPDPG